MKIHGKRSTAAVVFALILCLMLGHISAFAASESAEVQIPVSCTGADCTAVLLDEDGNVLQTLALKAGEASYFSVTCDGLLTHSFSLKLTDTDTSRITYDKTVYTVNVMLFYGEDGQVHYVIEADPTGVLGDKESGKPTELAFKNVVQSVTPSTMDITVKKAWVDDGDHPDSVTVRLLRGSSVAGTAVLNDGNGWSHTFKNLSGAYEYNVEEAEVPEGYTVSITWNGNTCTVTNTKDGMTPRPYTDDPPVKKIVDGDPAEASTFAFVLEADDPAYPMPEGSTDGMKEITITGEGESEFGVLTFTEAGSYSYTVVERDTGADGYTYDKTIYDVSYEITEQDGQLVSVRTIKRDGVVVTDFTAFTFTNVYGADGPTPSPSPSVSPSPSPSVSPSPSPNQGGNPSASPKTGDDTNLTLWVTLAAVSLGLIVFLSILLRFTEKKSKKKDSSEGR